MTGDVLALLPSLTRSGGGIELHGRTLLERLAKLRPTSTLTLVTRHETALARPTRISVALADRLRWAHPLRGDRVGFVARALWAGLRARPRLVLCGHLHHAPLALAAARLSRDARVVVFAHGVEAWAVGRASQRLALGHVDRVVAVSQFTESALARQGLSDAARRRVVRNAIDFSRFAGASAERGRRLVAARFGEAITPCVLSVARLDANERYKGVDLVIDALALLRGQGRRLGYLIVGDGSDRSRLEAYARERDVDAYFWGQAEDDELVDLFAASDVYAMPSRGEGFGYVFVEAMAAGVPVVAARGDASAETLGDGALGALVDLESPAALAAALLEQLALPETQRMARRAEAERRYGLSRLDTDLSSLLSELGV